MTNESALVQSEAIPFVADTTIEAAIMDRRTVKQFAARPVPRDLLEHLIQLAVWAPNHRLTEPWRFYVLDGASRADLAAIAADITREKLAGSGADADVIERKAAEAAAGWANVPALVYVTTVMDPRPDVDLENYGAVCCAIQNLSLAAHAHGLGTSWSSGAVADAPALRERAGAGDNERMVGLIRIGYPDPNATAPTSQRASGATHTTWLDEAIA
jgi:nitroreductase